MVDLREREEAAAVEFRGVQVKGAFVMSAVEAQMFPAGGVAGRQAGDLFDVSADAEFSL